VFSSDLVTDPTLGLEVAEVLTARSRDGSSGTCGVECTLGLDRGLECNSVETGSEFANSAGRDSGSVVLLVPVDIDGRDPEAYADCGLLLKSVCDRAAGRDDVIATGTGVVALRLALDFLLLRRSPVDCDSKCVA
jgi:hypothetical protein